MPTTRRATARRAGSLLAAFGVLLSIVLVAGPAQAAPVVNLSADDTTIALGESVTLSWDAADSTTLVASGDWTGDKAIPNGSEDVTPASAGTFTYTLTADNPEDPESSDSVTVTVEPGPITPLPVTFPDDCTVVVPATPNVTYFVDYGDGDIEEVEADTYPGTDFSFPDFPVTFFAEANDGFTLADGAVTEWEYTVAESCLPVFVTADATCGEVTFENVVDEAVTVLYGSEDEEEADGELQIAGGASETISTNREEILFIAYADELEEGQFGFLEVPQDCEGGSGGDGGSDHPTVAPAAGVAAR